MSTIGVFIALGGTSYAVTQLPRNSVGDRQLKPNAVTGAKIRDLSVGPADLAPNAIIAGARGARGPAGPPGAAGAPGPPGLQGGRGPSGARASSPKGVIAIPRPANTPVTVARLDDLAPGRWVLLFSGEFNWYASGALLGVCVINADGVQITGANATLGDDDTRSVPVSLVGVLDKSTTADVTVDCFASATVPEDGRPPVTVLNRQLVAVQVDEAHCAVTAWDFTATYAADRASASSVAALPRGARGRRRCGRADFLRRRDSGTSRTRSGAPACAA